VKRNHPGPLQDVIAKNIRRLRAELGLLQESLALDSGINRSYLSGAEFADRNVSVDNIARIVKALKFEPCILLRDEKLKYIQLHILRPQEHLSRNPLTS
jgi:transcriptional regulator with XRE-family HTH domain